MTTDSKTAASSGRPEHPRPDDPDWFLDDPELVIAIVHWAMSRGAIITRSWFGLNQDIPDPHPPATASARYEARWLREIRDITAEAGGRIRALLFPAHVHDDDGTVEGCPGCFPPGEVIGQETLRRADKAAAADNGDLEYGPLKPEYAGWHRPPSGDDPGQMCAPGASTAEDDACARLMLISELDLTQDQAAHAVLAARTRGGSYRWPDGSVLTARPGGTWELRRTAITPWPDLTSDYDVGEILAAIRVVDAYLDDAAPACYRDNPLANRWRRIAAGPVSEAVESADALNLATGGNPRKGITGDDSTILGELGDTASSALLAIQSITKDTDVTWAVFIAALAKALGRVPGPGPAPATHPDTTTTTTTTTTTEGDQ